MFPAVLFSQSIFQSTRPVWGVTQIVRQYKNTTPEAISIHTPRVGRDRPLRHFDCENVISIHTPRVGRDLQNCKGRNGKNISIHTPRVGRDFLIELGVIPPP